MPQELASILPLCSAQIAYFARTPPDQTLPRIATSLFTLQTVPCSAQLMWTLCRFCFIKAFSNDPLPCLISEPQSVVHSLCVRSPLLLFLPLLPSDHWHSMVYTRPISGRENNKTSRCPRQSPLGCHGTAPPLSCCCCCSDVGKPASDADTSFYEKF